MQQKNTSKWTSISHWTARSEPQCKERYWKPVVLFLLKSWTVEAHSNAKPYMYIHFYWALQFSAQGRAKENQVQWTCAAFVTNPFGWSLCTKRALSAAWSTRAKSTRCQCKTWILRSNTSITGEHGHNIWNSLGIGWSRSRAVLARIFWALDFHNKY